ncbi:hypothetical protein ABB37_08951 [Leptomonas pyrrhocoris]|uniref:Nop14-like family protein n=1 Tax=Leptomonas pyrrhocoris TaxID=157538 RepID=A0A0N0VDA6_LEPPY|nr:hypothetical protein ABB37_08951 [Leptomonas pyrrhocoris]XP_015653433.1 hypothetical protein ABB37_08951 [Leptomonas pyrrhocoris]KPA74993.1 hypothetical protein ABB37_08951 [Leptomonas pyrrhocoris]KPA74994.1 hypothetical protein ABB37_08951 [Leptomonas pyrrhocoris]|eukprot:XP_015653432.1 hypothetical protein ABB37_08951 [Leptomonas pyrrhocoris]
MAGSRAAHNAKLVQRHQRQQSNALAKSATNKFTQKQSHFERRREEEQVRQQGDVGGNGAVNASRSVGDGLLSRGAVGGGGGGVRSGSRYTPAEEEVRETPNPFARSRASHGGNAASPFASTRSATMGMDKSLKSTRTTRRIDRFNLSGGGGGAAASAAPSSLMGVRRVREGEATGLDGLDENSAAPPSKMTRAEKFREMISNSKGQRAQLQRERAERDAATLQLDAEINDLLHLLPRRNKTEEEQEAFAQSGTAEVRALLASYRRGHEAKCLTLKSSGAFDVRPLADAARAPDRRAGGAAQASAAAAALADPTAPAPPTHAVLDAADRALLAQIRNGAARSIEEREEAEVTSTTAAAARFLTPGFSPQTATDTATRAAPPKSAVTDDFDAVMQSFQADTRRAHAVARTLTEEEEAARDAQQALLREDRQQVPSLHLQERDQTQLTRGEWVEQGGDVAFQMDDGEAHASGEDNVDIPSSFEGDSEADDLDGEDAESEGALEGAEAAEETAAAVSADRVSGSQRLDHLLEELEKLATAAPATATSSAGEGTSGSKQQQQQHLHSLLVQLHHYASSHVVDATKAFRLILVEAERSFLRGTRRGGIRRALLVYLYAITKIFPTSDYRHEVMTPFLLFLCSALMQMKLDSLEAVHGYLVLTTLLLHCLKAGGGRYCAEVVVAVLNVLSLQLPRAVLEPMRYQGSRLPIPLMDRPDAALLRTSCPSSDSSAAAGEAEGGRAAYQIGLMHTTHDPQRLLLCAYHIYDELCELYRTTPAFPVMCATPFLRLDALLLQPHSLSAAGSSEPWQPSRAVRLAHEALAVKVRDIAAAVQHHRTPLAMRTFRPRPIRQFDPLLAEREENAVKNEVRIMKRDIREDKKRLMRHLTAEATVQRRAQEKRTAVDDAQREKRYHSVMHQLQQQQHSMNTVESLKSRAKAAKKKGLSGESNAKAADSEGAA